MAALATTSAWALDTGMTAPDISWPGINGSVNLSRLKGKVVYLDFWASWCGPCRRSFPFMNALLAKYRTQGLEVVAINLDAKRQDADKFLADVPAQFTLAFDAAGTSAGLFGVKAMPSSYLVARDGRVIEVHRGFNDEDIKQLESRIAAALSAP